MARIVRKKTKKRIRWFSVVSAVFMFSMILFFVTTVFIRNENTRLMKTIQDTQKETRLVEVQNETLKNEILQLQNRDRIISMAKAAGLSVTENVTTIRSGE